MLYDRLHGWTSYYAFSALLCIYANPTADYIGITLDLHKANGQLVKSTMHKNKRRCGISCMDSACAQLSKVLNSNSHWGMVQQPADQSIHV